MADEKGTGQLGLADLVGVRGGPDAVAREVCSVEEGGAVTVQWVAVLEQVKVPQEA